MNNNINLFVKGLYSPVNRTGSPQGFEEEDEERRRGEREEEEGRLRRRRTLIDNGFFTPSQPRRSYQGDTNVIKHRVVNNKFSVCITSD